MNRVFEKEALVRRLNGYWKLEAANVVLVPAAIVFTCYALGGTLGLLSASAMLVMAALLMVGAAYWRAKLIQIEGGSRALGEVLRWAARLKSVFAATSMTVFAAALASWFVTGLSVSLADRIAASIAATLAVLEYVNYYHRQLQHFDNMADWKRLWSGKGFRRSQLASDLTRVRSER